MEEEHPSRSMRLISSDGRDSMIKWFIRRFIPDYEKTTDLTVRKRYGILAGVIGIGCNLLLFSTKLAFGLISASIAVISDAFNNLSDMGASLVAIVGSKISGSEPDKEHPYGHGRFEYIASLIVSFIIISVGIELARNSVDKIINPVVVKPSLVLYIILGASVLVKLWMFSYNTTISKAINSKINKATALDSLNDVGVTMAVFASVFFGGKVSFPLDGIVGLVVAGLIFYTGVKIAVDMMNVLIGHGPQPKLAQRIESIVTSEPIVIGTHDLIVHDYGPGKQIASIHAEVDETMKLIEAHGAIDRMEKKVMEELGVDLVIHIDPVKPKKEK